MRRPPWRLLAPVGLMMTMLVGGSATQAASESGQAPDPKRAGWWCEHSFDRTIDRYVGSHPIRDVDMLASTLHDEWTVIFADGELLVGKEEGLAWVREEFFSDPSWTQSFTEVRRVVRGCSTGFILFDSIYEQPGYRTHLMIGLSLTYERGRWLVIQDQNSRVEEG
jgi:hypothetical protein